MSTPRRLGGIAAVLLLWLALLTIAFHGYGGARRRTLHHTAFHLPTPRKMLLAMASFDADDDHHHRDRHHGRRHHHRHHHHHRVVHDGWNRQGIPPAAGPGEEVDPRFGVQKRLVPTGPNPLHH
uniref:FON2 SPARE1 n=1 Tax=Leersia perrieri TaxID=77586 RepID=A0A0D9VFF5_9ORYZ